MTAPATDYVLEISFAEDEAGVDELVQSALFLAAARGSSVRDAEGRTIVTAYFDSLVARAQAESALEGMQVSLRTEERERVDWLERYEQSLHPILIGTRFVVAPDPGLLAAGAGRLPIVVPQEQAFGTGSHETTALCMTLLETLTLAGRRGLDVGSGSGILALAMLALGASKVVAFDNDLDAYAALRDNRLRNRVSDARMPLFIGGAEALRGGVFDVVTMNIIPEVIIPLLGAVVARMSSDGALVLSGVLRERRDEVLAAAAQQELAPESESERGEWWAGVLRRQRLPTAT